MKQKITLHLMLVFILLASQAQTTTLYQGYVTNSVGTSYGAVANFTTSLESLAPETITFDDQGFTGCQVINDTQAFTAIGTSFNIYAANFDGSVSADGALWYETATGGCWHNFPSEFENGGYVTAGYLTDEADKWYAPEALVVKTSDGSDFKFTSFKAHDAEWNSWGNYLKVIGYRDGAELGSESVVIVSNVEPYHSNVVLSNPLFQNVDEVRIVMDKDNNPDFGDPEIPYSNAEGLFHSFDTFVVEPAVPLSTAPTLNTSAATLLTANGATLNGNVTDDGGASVDARGFVYSALDATPTIGEGDVTNVSDDGSGTGSFSEAITGLSAATTYYYQAYATNSVGTSYGGVESFTISTLNIDTVNAPSGFSIYPNPSSDIINITSTRSDDFQIVDMLGKVIHTFKVGSQIKTTVNVTMLSEGLYFVRAMNSNYTHKLVVKK